MNKTILIIDGNAVAPASLVTAVSAEGYAVQTAATSEEGSVECRSSARTP